jgi:hypothetical protein
MKRVILLVVVCLTTLLFTGCANNSARTGTTIRGNLSNEFWMQRINLDPNMWTKNASPWFFTNEPTRFDQYASNSPLSSAISIVTVRVPDFTKIKIDGPFRVQIAGRQEHNSVNIMGANALTRHTAVDIRGDTLFLHPASECTSGCGHLDQVVVRIGMRELHSLVDSGTGSVEAKDIDSSGLVLISTNCANILMVGDMTVTDIAQQGTGTISLLGVNTPALNINIYNNGSLNVSGHVNVKRIMKQGSGNLNILGATSDGLIVKSSGSGVTTVAGYTNLKRLDAEGNSRVYIYWVNSAGMYVNIRDHSHVGLAGSTTNLDVDLSNDSRFLGKYLRANNVYIRTRDYSHANINPADKLFANAMDNSSIYFFNAPNIISRYTLGNGVVVPVFNDDLPAAPVPVAGDTSGIPDSVYKGLSR